MIDTTQPLADALNAIASIVDESESDGDSLMDMLNRIERLCIECKRDYLAAVMAQQKADLAAMRAASVEG
jgi:hypothetical protein